MAFENICYLCTHFINHNDPFVKLNKDNFNKLDDDDLYAHPECLVEYNENKYVQLKLFR